MPRAGFEPAHLEVVSANCRPSGSADNAALIIGGPDFTPSGSMIVTSIIQFNAVSLEEAVGNTVDRFQERNLEHAHGAVGLTLEPR